MAMIDTGHEHIAYPLRQHLVFDIYIIALQVVLTKYQTRNNLRGAGVMAQPL